MFILSDLHLQTLLENAWDCGFNESGEGYNGEYLREGANFRVESRKNKDIRRIINELPPHYRHMDSSKE